MAEFLGQVKLKLFVICLPMEQLRLLKNLFKHVHVFKIELEFGGVGF